MIFNQLNKMLGKENSCLLRWDDWMGTQNCTQALELANLL